MRKIVALAVAIGLLALTAGCSTGAPSGACVSPIKSGDASSIVTASGAFATKTTVKFPTPLVTKGEEVTTIDKGAGAPVYRGQFADFQATVLNAKTGDVLFTSSFDKAKPARYLADATKAGINAILECQTVGSRIAATMTVKDFAGSKGIDAQYGLGLTDTVVFVVDIVAKYLGRADGVDQLAQPGLPAVVLAPNGQPGITLPHQSAPTTLEIEVLKRGDGVKVKKGDTVIANYSALIWDSNTMFDSNWDKVANDFVASSGTGGVIPGFAKAIIGQTVGSQVLVVIPPKYGYTGDSLPTGLTSKSTLVFVIDLLGVHS